MTPATTPLPEPIQPIQSLAALVDSFSALAGDDLVLGAQVDIVDLGTGNDSVNFGRCRWSRYLRPRRQRLPRSDHLFQHFHDEWWCWK